MKDIIINQKICKRIEELIDKEPIINDRIGLKSV